MLSKKPPISSGALLCEETGERSPQDDCDWLRKARDRVHRDYGYGTKKDWLCTLLHGRHPTMSSQADDPSGNGPTATSAHLEDLGIAQTSDRSNTS